MSSYKEKRRHPRKPYYMPVEYASKDKNYKEYIHDISAGGVFIMTQQYLPVGHDIVMSIPLHNHSYVKIKGIVTWTNAEGIAVKFDDGVRLRLELIASLVDEIKAISI